ncbi:SRPBCC family protein [Arthrobacter sp. 35W]|uniref:SRPBCC family protein n=1 Tax=Arthrobacter sp. 35W TaxID=1132441 RepID=UPI000413055C|nr:SRPBCC family protein [Arthrobacter sp. 35W]
MSTKNSLTITAEPGVPFIDTVRELDAPLDAVYRAYTDPALITQWMGPRNLAMEIVEFDPRAGGRWNYIHRDPEGNAFGFKGVFHSITPGEQMLQTFEFDGYPGHVSLERVTFEDLGGRTKVSTHAVYQTVEDRDGMVASGMEGGMAEGYDRMEELLAGVASGA